MASSQFVWSDEAPDGTPTLGVVARRVYRLRESGLTVEADNGWRPGADDVLAMFRQTTDVVLTGSAHSVRGPVARLTTQLQVGPVQKRVDVVGDRHLRVAADGTLSETAPSVFSAMPIAAERAYGGRDETAESLIERTGIEAYGTLSYPRNARGCGYFFDVERARLDGERLPNLSDPDDPVSVDRLLATQFGDWIDRPTPATYASIDGSLFPRLLHNAVGITWSKQERPVREVVLGAITEADLRVSRGDAHDVRACNAAAPGLATRQLTGNEPVSLWNLHPRHEHLAFDLPGDVPRLLIEPPNTKTFELEPKLATVHIEPDADRVTLIWAGAMQVGAIYPPNMCAAMRRGVLWS